jgi:PKD repeat protein
VSYEEFRASLYCEEGLDLCIVERDVPLIGEEAIRDYYDRVVYAADPRPNALTVMNTKGQDAKWDMQTRMNLTYCVDDGFGTRKQFIIDAMEDAALAWEAAASIDFKYVSSADSNCTTSNSAVLFNVSPSASTASYLARAFFPNYPNAYRSVLVNLSSFDNTKAAGGEIGRNLSMAGILRHELGHVLGFRHEHIRPEAQAYKCAEDDNFRPITPYDSESVMHYPQCNGDGDWSLTLTQSDRQGAAQYYPAQPTSTPQQQRCTKELDDAGHVREECEPVKNEILRVANTATFEQLDVELSLDVRAANGLIDAREQKPFENFDELLAVPYVTDNVIRDIYDVLYDGDCTFSVDADGNYPIACLTTVFDILDVANTASQETLDDDIALDARAAGNIVAIRNGNPFDTMDELWAVSYVKEQAVTKIYDWIQLQDITVDITADVQSGTAPLDVEFVANARGAEAPLSYDWDFGDGSANAEGESVTHTYDSAGDFTATVTVTDANGESNSDTIDIAVEQTFADFVITDFTATVDRREATFEITVENQGDKDIDDTIYVVLFRHLDAPPTPSDTPSRYLYILDGLAAGDSTRLSHTFEDLPLGDFEAHAAVNIGGSIPESDETNNKAGPLSYRIEALVINEVLYTTPGPDSGTFIELLGNPGTDLSGYTIEGINGRDGGNYETITLPAGTTIPTDGYFVVGDSTTANADLVSSDTDLQNGPDSVQLVNPSGTVVDALGYGEVDATETFAGEGQPAVETPNGYSVGRNAWSRDTDDNAADFFQWASPTPGAPNYTSLHGQADTCADAYTVSDGVEGRFKVHGNLAGLTNDFTSLNVDECSVTKSTLGGAEQVLRVVVPDGVTADIEFHLESAGTTDIDAVITADPCTSLESGFLACNAIWTTNLNDLSPGAYHIVVVQDATSATPSDDEPYTYELDIDYK